jgi:hypothetical protein
MLDQLKNDGERRPQKIFGSATSALFQSARRNRLSSETQPLFAMRTGRRQHLMCALSEQVEAQLLVARLG